jgi:flagellar hook-associated protein 3 FlgL
MRVTSQMLFNTTIKTMQQQSSRLLRTQEEAATGRKMLHLSDDAVGARRISSLRHELSSLEQFQKNQDRATAFLQATENALQEFETILFRAQELTIAAASDGMVAEDRAIIAEEVKQLAAQALALGNTEFAERSIFAGQAGIGQPAISTNGTFVGDSSAVDLQIHTGQTLTVNLVGSEFLASDLRPNIDVDTPLASLHRGQGVNLGAIAITDRAGNGAVIDLTSATTVGDVLSAISTAGGIDVTATINSTGDGITITDNQALQTQNLIVSEVGNGTLASELGIAANRSGAIVGQALQPAVVATTPLDLLHGGEGGDFTTIRVTNGAAEADVDLSLALTVGDVIAAINSSGVNVTASINADGTALDVISNDIETVAIVTDLDQGKAAVDLGIAGAHDILKTLDSLRDALEKNDTQALNRLLTQLDGGLNQVGKLQGDIGARLNRVDQMKEVHTEQQLLFTSLMSQTRDADAVEAFSRLTQQSIAFEAALASTARVIQPTLLDFLR